MRRLLLLVVVLGAAGCRSAADRALETSAPKVATAHASPAQTPAHHLGRRR